MSDSAPALPAPVAAPRSPDGPPPPSGAAPERPSLRPAPPPTPPESAAPEDDRQLPLLEHLGELRTRLLRAVAGLAVGVVGAFFFWERIFEWLMAPVYAALPKEHPNLVFTSALEPFWVNLKISFYAGLFVAAPWVLYQLWAFVAPGLYRRERRMVWPFVSLGTVSFLGGGAFARYVVLPFAFDFLVNGFKETGLRLEPMLNMEDQLTLVLTLLVAFGVIFEMPLLLSLLARLGVVTSAGLRRYRRHAVVANTIVAAIITPTGDPFNLALMAVPMCVCYELGIVGARFMEKRRAAQAATTPESGNGSGPVQAARSGS